MFEGEADSDTVTVVRLVDGADSEAVGVFELPDTEDALGLAEAVGEW